MANQKIHSPAGSAALVVATTIILFSLVMALFLINAGWILLFDVVVAAGFIFLTKRKPEYVARIKQAFKEQQILAWGLMFILLLIVPILLKGSPYWLFILIMAGRYMVACFGLNLQLGSTGMMNLAGAAFMAFGAYTAGLLSLNFGLPPIITLFAGALVTGLFSVLLFIPVLKTKGHYLALVTIAFQYIVVILVENMEWTGGPQGLKNIPLFSIAGYSFNDPIRIGSLVLHQYTNFYFFILILVFVLAFAVHRLYNSWVGITLSTIRDDEIAAKTNGVIVNYWKLVIFIIGNCLIGLAGAFYSHMVGFISPPNFQFDISLVMVSIVILGGMDNLLGIVLGSILLIVLPEKLRVIQDYRFLIYGLVLIGMLIFQPRGVLPFVPRSYQNLINRFKSRKVISAESEAAGKPA